MDSRAGKWEMEIHGLLITHEPLIDEPLFQATLKFDLPLDSVESQSVSLLFKPV